MSAQSNVSSAGDDACGDACEQVQSGSTGSSATAPRSTNVSAADTGITNMMQMLRDEGIDIDARMAQARADCRTRIVAETDAEADAEAGAKTIEQAVEDCAVVEDAIIYAQAINEMNANRVSNFNDAKAQHDAEVAEAERKQREYELGLQRHTAEVAEVERQQRDYQRDLLAHQQLVNSMPTGSRSSAPSSPPNPATALAGNSSSPAVTAAPAAKQAAPPVPVQASAPPPAISQPSSAATLASNTPSQPSQSRAGTRSTGGTQSSAPARATGRMLSQSDTAPADSVELAIMKATGPRIALVIGNEKYDGSMGSLSNPVNDAVLIGATLRSLGFDVEILTDASQADMKRAVRRLGDRLADAGDNATGLFYYAGHGVQSDGANYLIPVGAAIDAESDLELEAVSAASILSQLEETYVSTRIVILDACRNMPLRRRTRDGSRGLARMDTPNGSFVAYSTSPGNTATDGGGIHSPFAEALAAQMLVPDRPIEVTFREVRRQVVEMTNGDQVPWDASSLLETFSFAGVN
ncbi:MAG: caspase family protein [Erythrobacter sp.]|uniref:caspase family protein n=1 Tax=Erythrobacter sp. TaxID=1042 RepID=UPI003A89FEBB